MGKSLRAQRRGKGSFTFIATKKGTADVRYLRSSDTEPLGVLSGQVLELETDAGRSAVLARVLFSNGKESYMIAAEGLTKGQSIEMGKNAQVGIGNVLPVAQIPEGCPIFCVEKMAEDGGSLVRASGLYGLIMSKTAKNALVKLSSGKTIELPLECRATIGCVAGGGRHEKPMLKAGTHFHLMKARRRHYPGLRGVAMNAVDHPFGGSQHHAGKSKSTKRNAPPGRKVGAIASSRTGRRKR
ncbi:MAG: 50S ribosomal protein L2 [Candidatus Diapherotrites archaeon]|uniref:50S ribosomal protein L2 n=1 Tax=Candidatus Iainarchaeum sp. TaxID=3101447 RepID=A0A8T4L954_9ARCH|nr:50S ribosomal protein L2 [Candidatus Diapherotrites archaeon]